MILPTIKWGASVWRRPCLFVIAGRRLHCGGRWHAPTEGFPFVCEFGTAGVSRPSTPGAARTAAPGNGLLHDTSVYPLALQLQKEQRPPHHSATS